MRLQVKRKAGRVEGRKSGKIRMKRGKEGRSNGRKRCKWKEGR